MTGFLQSLVDGTALGAVYVLIALGCSLMHGVLRLINFAQAGVFMVGTFTGCGLLILLPAGSLAVAVPGAMVTAAILGIVIERWVYRPLRTSPSPNLFVASIGVALLIGYGGRLILGSSPREFPMLVSDLRFQSAGLDISAAQLTVIGVALLLMAMLKGVVFHTRMGLAMRAIAQNRNSAQLVGVNLNLVTAFIFALGSALAGAAGVLHASLHPVIEPLATMGPGIMGIVAAIIGGLGSLRGALAGGLLLALLKTTIAGSPGAPYGDAVAFGLLMLVLFFKPTGLFGPRSV